MKIATSRSLCFFGISLVAMFVSGCNRHVATESQGWNYPGAKLVDSETIDSTPGATRTSYQTTDDPEVVQDYYLRQFAGPDWQLNNLQTNRISRNGIHSGGMSGLSSDEDQFMQINILRDGSSETLIVVTHVPDLPAVREARRPSTEQVEPSSAESLIPDLPSEPPRMAGPLWVASFNSSMRETPRASTPWDPKNFSVRTPSNF